MSEETPTPRARRTRRSPRRRRRRARVGSAELPLDPRDVDEELPQDLPGDDPVNELLELIGDDRSAEITVYRVDPRPRFARGPAFLQRFSGTVPTLEEIRESFGGGTFLLKVRVAGESAYRTVAIEGTPRFVGVAGAEPEISRELEELRKLVSVPRPSQTPDEEDRRAFRALFRELFMVKMAAEIMKPAPQSATPAANVNAADPFESFERFLKLYHSLQEDAAPPWWGSLETALDRLLPAPHEPQNGKPTVSPEEHARLNDFLKHVARAIDANTDPDTLAQWSLSQLPPEIRSMIPTLEEPHWYSVWHQYAPAYPSFAMPSGRAWLGRFLISIKRALKPAPAPAGFKLEQPTNETDEAPRS